MATYAFAQHARVAYKGNLKYRGSVYDIFDGTQDIPHSAHMYRVIWDGVAGYYYYYASDLIAEKEAQELDKQEKKEETNEQAVK